MEGKVLNLRDIEQGMEQIIVCVRSRYRLKYRPVTVRDVGGDTDGIAGMACHRERGHRNSGQKSTGTGQLNGVLSFNNLWGWLTTGLSAGDGAVTFRFT